MKWAAVFVFIVSALIVVFFKQLLQILAWLFNSWNKPKPQATRVSDVQSGIAASVKGNKIVGNGNSIGARGNGCEISGNTMIGWNNSISVSGNSGKRGTGRAKISNNLIIGDGTTIEATKPIVTEDNVFFGKTHIVNNESVNDDK